MQPGARADRYGAARFVWLSTEVGGVVQRGLWITLGLLLFILLLVPQLPFAYQIDVGYEEGVGSDLPLVQGFHTAEYDDLGSYRWSTDGARIVVPGVGGRTLLVRLHWLATPAAVQAISPRDYELFAGGVSLGRLSLPAAGGIQHVLVPASLVEAGKLILSIHTDTFSLAGDPRALGARLSRVELVSLASAGLVLPDWYATGAWLIAVGLGWLTLQAALRSGRAVDLGPVQPPWAALPALGLGAGLVALAALLDPPRWAFGAEAVLIACALAYPLALVTGWFLPRLARRLMLPLDGSLVGWLVLLIVLSFALRYGGRLYPASMHGDIGFHHNRFNETVWGQLALVSINRGVPFPYPPGPYTLVAPLVLLGLSPRTLLQFSGALADAFSAALVYALAVRAIGQRTAFLAAAIYILTAATFMTTWWSFSTHIYTQFFHLLALTGVVLVLECWRGTERVPQVWSWLMPGLLLGLLLSLVFLGHFGFLINTTLLAGLLIALIWLLSGRGIPWARQIRWPFSLVLGGVGLFAVIFFYSAYLPMFREQLATAQVGGLTAVAGRAPVSRAILWQRLWRDGFVIHFGLFPFLLLPAGIWQFARRIRRDEQGLGPGRTLLWLMLGSLVVASVFAIFPFVAGVSNSPRWLMFIVWVVALGAAVAGERLWQRGWAGRLAMLIMGGVVLANTFWIWLGPMLWRIRPPEPM